MRGRKVKRKVAFGIKRPLPNQLGPLAGWLAGWLARRQAAWLPSRSPHQPRHHPPEKQLAAGAQRGGHAA